MSKKYKLIDLKNALEQIKKQNSALTQEMVAIEAAKVDLIEAIKNTKSNCKSLKDDTPIEIEPRSVDLKSGWLVCKFKSMTWTKLKSPKSSFLIKVMVTWFQQLIAKDAAKSSELGGLGLKKHPIIGIVPWSVQHTKAWDSFGNAWIANWSSWILVH